MTTRPAQPGHIVANAAHLLGTDRLTVSVEYGWASATPSADVLRKQTVVTFERATAQ